MLTFGKAGAGSSQNTASVSATPGRRVIVFAHAYKSGTSMGELALAGGGITWTRINHGVDTQFSQVRRVSAWKGVTPASGVLTLSVPDSWSLVEWYVVEVGGSADVAQSKYVGTTSGTTLTVTFDAASGPLAGYLGFIASIGGVTNLTPTAPLTEMQEQIEGGRDNTEVASRDTPTTALVWTGGAGTGNQGIGVELVRT